MTAFTEDEYYDEKFNDLQLANEELSSVRFYDCTFRNCDFSEAALRACKFSGCTFENCNLNFIKVTDSEFVDVSFVKCKVVGVNWTEADWPRTAGRRMLSFNQCTISHSTFIGLKLPGCAIVDCMAKNADFREAELADTSFAGSDLTESLFGDTTLTGADFTRATGYAINPTQNRIQKAKFMLPEATSLLYNMDIEIVD
ncbi:pentapeptide repeat-containing protein [Cohnella sp. GCM10020058]|uniref:pentapeptide repeat-containing protein n=1 Tax=Cohnella sp. GCM10020058 TaxID=3317330 RepID=UPI0036358D57